MQKRRMGRYLDEPGAWMEETRAASEVSKLKKEIVGEMESARTEEKKLRPNVRD